MSLVNRRLYQQGRDYYVKKITVTSRDTVSGLISFGTAPSSWSVHSGWKMAKKLFDEMRLAHGGAPGSGMPSSITPATWADFKVFLTDTHRADSANELLCRDNGNNLVSTSNSEWTHSKYQSPDGGTGADVFFTHLLGAHNGAAGSRVSVGAVEAFEESRRTVQIDDSGDEIDTDSPWINLFDDGTTLDEIAADMLADGDNPPYDRVNYAGGGVNMPKPLVQALVALAATGQVPVATAPSVVVGGFNAPCGLVEIEVQSTVADDVFDVLIEVASGSYKGVKALPM